MSKNDMKMLVSLAVSFIIVIFMGFLTILEIKHSSPMEPIIAIVTACSLPCAFIGWMEVFGKSFKFDDLYTHILNVALFVWYMTCATMIILLNFGLVKI